MPFDLLAARASKKSDTEIVDYLGDSLGFDVAAARKLGKTDTEIAEYLSTHERPAHIKPDAVMGNEGVAFKPVSLGDTFSGEQMAEQSALADPNSPDATNRSVLKDKGFAAASADARGDMPARKTEAKAKVNAATAGIEKKDAAAKKGEGVAPRTATEGANDLYVAGKQGLLNVNAGGSWLLDQLPGVDTGGFTASQLEESKRLNDDKSEYLKAANKSVEDADGFFGTMGALIDNPAAIGDLIAQNASFVIPGMATGAAGAKIGGAMAARKAAQVGATEEAIAAAALAGRTTGAAVGGTAGESAISGGISGAQVEEQILGTDPAVLAQKSARYRELSTRMSPEQAREQLADEVSLATAAATGAATAVGGFIANKANKLLGLGDPYANALVQQITVKGALKSTAGEVTQEMTQSPLEQIGGNLTNVDDSTGVMDDVTKSIALGAVGALGQSAGTQGIGVGMQSLKGEAPPVNPAAGGIAPPVTDPISGAATTPEVTVAASVQAPTSIPSEAELQADADALSARSQEKAALADEARAMGNLEMADQLEAESQTAAAAAKQALDTIEVEHTGLTGIANRTGIADAPSALALSAAELANGQLDTGNRAALGLDQLRDNEELQPIAAPAAKAPAIPTPAQFAGRRFSNDDTLETVAAHRLAVAKHEILQDIADGHIPDTVQSFVELQDHVDANMYVNDAEREDRLIGPIGKKEGWTRDIGEKSYVGFTNKLINSIDQWLANGRNDGEKAPASKAAPSAQFDSSNPIADMTAANDMNLRKRAAYVRSSIRASSDEKFKAAAKAELKALTAEIDGRNASPAGPATVSPDSVPAPVTAEASPIAGEAINAEWTAFAPDSGTLSIPRAEMPQIKAEHRGAMVNFLKARGITSDESVVKADSLKPTQAEFSPGKVKKAKSFTGGDRSILVSSDNHILDGHHQWLAKRDAGEDVKVIKLGAPIKSLLSEVAEFPSATTDDLGADDAPVIDTSPVIPADKRDGEGLPPETMQQKAVRIARMRMEGQLNFTDLTARDAKGKALTAARQAGMTSDEIADIEAVAENTAESMAEFWAIGAKLLNEEVAKRNPEPPKGSKPAEIHYPNRKLGFERAKADSDEPHNPSALANIALANLQPGDVVKVGNNTLTVKSIGSKAVTFTKQDGKITRFDIDTPRMAQLARDVDGLITASQHGADVGDWIKALSRDPAFSRDEQGIPRLMDAPAEQPAEADQTISVPEDAFADALAQAEEDGYFTEPAKTIRAEDVAKAGAEMSQDEANKQIAEWKAAAKKQGKSGVNSGKVVLSLFDTSGSWSQPWVDAGYEVHRFDIQDGMDINDFSVEYLTEKLGIDRADVVLAAPPCTDFSSSGAHAWKKKDADGRTAAAIQLVHQAVRVVEFFKPAVWALENPVGRIQKLTGLPKPTMTFQPNNYGNPYTKRTLLWGSFNSALPQANVSATEGSKMTTKLSGSDKYGRSLTPEGFAYSFFAGNNLQDMGAAGRLAAEFRGIPLTDIQAALDAGLSEQDVSSIIEDDINDGDVPAAVEKLRSATGGPDGEGTKRTDTDRRQADQPVANDQRHGARRLTRDDLSKPIGSMSPAELIAAAEALRAHIQESPLTGLPTKAVWEALAAADELGPFVASIDADALKWFNDNIGHQIGGDKLLGEIGKALKAAGVDAYHISGDEFYATADSRKSLESGLKAAQSVLNKAKIEGNGWSVTGVGFSYGIAATIDEAEHGLHADKQSRENNGLRAGRGEIPPGATRTGEGNGSGNQATNDRESEAAGRQSGAAGAVQAGRGNGGNGEARVNPGTAQDGQGRAARGNESPQVDREQEAANRREDQRQRRSNDMRARNAAAGIVNENVDDLLAAIAKLGGISRKDAEEQGIDSAEFGRRGHGIKRVFTSTGKSLDGMAESLHELGYPVVDDQGRYSANQLLDVLTDALSGKKVYTQNGAYAAQDRAGIQRALEDGDVAALPPSEHIDGTQAESAAAVRLIDAVHAGYDYGVVASMIGDNDTEADMHRLFSGLIAGEQDYVDRYNAQAASAGAGQEDYSPAQQEDDIPGLDQAGQTYGDLTDAEIERHVFDRVPQDQIRAERQSDDFSLETQSEADLAAKEAREQDARAAREAEQRREIDSARDAFTLGTTPGNTGATTRPRTFTYKVKPAEGGFIITSDDGGGIVMSGRPNGSGILNTVPPRIFRSETDARAYMQQKGMTEYAPAQAAAAEPISGVSAKDISDRLEREFPGIKLDLIDAKSATTISRIVVQTEQRNAGIGTAVMQRLADWADSNGKVLALTPSSDFGGSKERLGKFYKRFGFIENKGRSKDFAISESMLREPSSASPSQVGKGEAQDGDYTDILSAEADLWSRITDGTATVDEFKAGFDRWVSGKADIIVMLSKKTKADLLKMAGGMLAYRYKNDAKPAIVEAVWRDGMSAYALGSSITYGMGKDSYTNAVRRIVENTDADAMKQFADDRKAADEAAVTQRAEEAEAVKDPKSLDDFILWLRVRMSTTGATFTEARMAMTPEQRVAFDKLSAESTRDARVARKKAIKTAVRTAGQAVGGEIIATKHTRDDYDLFVVQLAERLGADDYKTVLESAKKLGGWYSAYRGNGATPGFQFKEKASAEAFLKLAAGDSAEAQAQAELRRNSFDDDRSQTAVERLTEMSDRLDQRADESLGAERKANTARRARFAASAEAAASADKAMAKTMRNIATAISEGKAEFLDTVRQKVQVELLTGMVRTAKDNEIRAKFPTYADQEKQRGSKPTSETADFAEFPSFTSYRSDLASLARQLLEVDGTKKIGQRLMKVADDVSDAYLEFAKANINKVATFSIAGGTAALPSKGAAEAAISRSGLAGKAIVLPVKRNENLIILSPSEAINRGVWTGDGDKRIALSRDFGHELVEQIGKKAKRNKLTVPWQLEGAADRLKALARLGIETPAELRSALREFIALQEQPSAPSKIKEMERAMIGRRNDGLDFFPTPQEIADQMIEAAGIEPGMSVLEPSAGMGHIAERIQAAGVDPDVVELSGDRRELLEAKGFRVVGNDFMDIEPRSFFTFGDTFRAPDGTEGVMRGLGGMGSNRVRLEEDGGRQTYHDRDDLTGIRKNGTLSGYDRIIMNPPFGDRRDAEHVRHAYSLLKPGGRLVAIMGEGVFFGADKKAQEFRDWLEKAGGTDEKLAENTFMDPSLPVNTGVSARMVVIEKPIADDVNYSKDSGWYSPLTRTVEGIKQETALASQWRAMIEKAPGVKADELEATGVIEYLKLKAGKVTKAEILSFLQDNGVQVSDVLRGAGASRSQLRADLDAMAVKYGLTPEEDGYGDEKTVLFMGGDDEVVDWFELPVELQNVADAYAGSVHGTGNNTKYSEYALPGGKNYRELLITLPQSVDSEDGAYRTSHWTETNILAHVRFDERTDADGKKVLFINEIQSDWGQEGKKKGFAGAFPENVLRAAVNGGMTDADARADIMRLMENPLGTDARPTAEQWRRLGAAVGDSGIDLNEVFHDRKKDVLPSAPFVTKTDAWVSLAIKRIIRHAAENGFDRVAFIGGEQSADLYDLSKQVSELRIFNKGDGKWEITGQSHAGDLMNIGEDIATDKLPEYVGKDLANRAVNEIKAGEGIDYSGIDLKVGGNGMRTFYDKIVPKVAGDVIKKLGGGKVQPISMTIGGKTNYKVEQDSQGKWIAYNPTDQHDFREFNQEESARAFAGGDTESVQLGFDITPAMRDTALAGLPLFSVGKGKGSLTAASLDTNLRNGPAGQAIGKMLDDGKIVIHSTVPAGRDATAQGWTTKSDGTIHLVANRLTTGTVVPTLFHELFHRGMRQITGTASHKRLMKDLEAIYKHYRSAPAGSATNKFWMAAMGRLDAALVPSADQVEEFGAYAVTAFEAAPRSLRKWVAEFVGHVKAWLLRTRGIQFGGVTPGQMRAIAVHALRAETSMRAAPIPDDAVAYSLTDTAGTIAVDGKSRPTANSNGQPIHQTQEGIENFWRWFGESKAVDADGRPLVVYHGTEADFDKFKVSNAEAYGEGIYFASDRTMPEGEFGAGGRVIDAYVRIINPSDGNVPDGIESTKAWADFQKEHGNHKGDAADAFENYTDFRNAAIRESGHDGVIVENDEYGIEVVAFTEGQAKSADANNGDYSSGDSNIYYSKTATVGDTYKLPPARAFITKIFDRFDRLDQVQKAVTEQGGSVTDLSDVYGQEEAYHSRAASAIDRFRRHRVGGLFKRMVKAGIAIEDVGLYLYAQHAPERNAQIAKLYQDGGQMNLDGTGDNRMQDGGSGMTNKEAADHMAEFQQRGIARKLDTFARELRDITKDSREILRNSGLETSAAIDAWEAAYQFYVPLSGKDEANNASSVIVGRGFDVRGGQKRAMGRKDMAKHVIEQIIIQHEQAVIRAEKNIVGKRLLQFVRDNPDDKLWQVNPVEQRRYIAADGQAEYRNQPLRTDRNVVSVRINGKDTFILLADQEMADAIHNVGTEDVGFLLRALGVVSRFTSKMFTAFSPAFIAVNALRDFQTAMLHGYQVGGIKYSANIVKNIPGALGELVRDVRKGDSKLVKLYEQSGGRTGMVYMIKDFEEKHNEVMHQMAALKGVSLAEIMQAFEAGYKEGFQAVGRKARYNKFTGVFDALVESVETVNGVMENMTRLAAFKAAIDEGKSTKEAGSIAKNLTVNFNRKGELAPTLGSLYIFFNASVQGTVRMAEALKNPKLQAVAVGMVLLSAALAAMQMGDDDDKDEDGRPDFEQIPAYQRSRNLIFMHDDGSYTKIPLPLGWNVFHAFGTELAVMARSKSREAYGTGAWNMLKGTVEMFNPVGDLTPSVAAPFLQIANNESHFGGPIYPEYKDKLPNSQQFYDGTEGSVYERATTIANEATGGNEYRPGMVDVNPEKLQHVVEFFGGGALRFLTDSADAVTAAADGGPLQPVDKLPIARAFVGQLRDEYQTSRYYENVGKVESIAAEIKGLEESGKFDEMAAVAEKNPMADSLAAEIRITKKALKQLKQHEREVRADEDLSEGELRQALQDIREERGQIVKPFNSMYEDAMRKGQ